MLIRNKKTFSLGVVFAISFLSVLALIFSPVFNGKNGLVFSDDSFNKLAKGSSYFIPKITKSVEKVAGKSVSISVKIDKADQVENTAKLFTTAGATATVNGQEMKVEGDLGAILQSALKDSDSMFNNDGKTVSDRYGYEEKTVIKNWWAALSSIEKGLKKDKLVADAKVVSKVIKKGVEPGYNFYKIDSNKVVDHAGMMSGLLIFYVAYTMWWGYAIFYMFDGLGLSMKKAKVKKEA
jgi:hypothetical protein